MSFRGLNQRLRSVLSDPLGLPLLYSLHGKNPSTLDYLSRESSFYDEKGVEATRFNDVFASEVTNWRGDSSSHGDGKPSITEGSPHNSGAQDSQKIDTQDKKAQKLKDEKALTKALSEEINKNIPSETNFQSHAEVAVYKHGSSKDIRGYIDILLTPKVTPEEGATPLALIEVGLHDDEWWKKVSQNLKYLHEMGQNQKTSSLRFREPLIFAVLTIEGVESSDLKVRLGVFLCSPKANYFEGQDCRMSLLWHSYTDTLEEASKNFGRLLRATSDLSRWRSEEKASGWKYLGPNCCRVDVYDEDLQSTGSKVLRSYDSRFRTTELRSEIYVSYLEDSTETVLELPKHGEQMAPLSADPGSFEDHLWQPDGQLLVLAIPYIEGRHRVEQPTDFVPIIDRLKTLHHSNYVHGDLRGFNIVFNDDPSKSEPIDYDFGGIVGPSTVFPSGYKNELPDGTRLGSEGEEIQKWHDWYALGKLIFNHHGLEPSDDANENLAARAFLASSAWERIGTGTPPSDTMITQLKTLLQDLEKGGWKIRPQTGFEEKLNEHQNTTPA